MEIWKDVIGYEGLYQVSNLGSIKSLGNDKTKKERILKDRINKFGYLRVVLYKYGNTKNKSVHQIVAESFLNHTVFGMELVINHKNFIRNDNRVENLEIVTARENSNQKHIESTSKYVGVHFHKLSNKWQSQIYINGKQKYLGLFDNEIDAHNSYQKAKELFFT